MPPPTTRPPPPAAPSPHSIEDDGDDQTNNRFTEPDNQPSADAERSATHPLRTENAASNNSSSKDRGLIADDKAASSSPPPPTSIRVQSAEESDAEKRKQEEEEERARKKKEEEDEDKEPCCTKKCACMPFLIFGYFLLGIFIFVGLILSFVFIILHFVMRLLHLIFWGMAKMRHSVEEVLDIERLQQDHEKQYKTEMQEWEHNAKVQKTNKEREDAERKRLGKKPKKDDSDDEMPAPSPYMRICGPTCVMKSGASCLGMSFNGLAYLWFILAFMFGFSSISIFTSVFPSCTVRGVAYLSNFRKDYDMDWKPVANASEKKEGGN